MPKEPFDSNCITPGTQFMADLSNCLHYYIRYKIGADSTWQTPTGAQFSCITSTKYKH